ncbi:MAG TPA: PadR family transcriptional regulator [Acidimicrobiales bacterium]
MGYREIDQPPQRRRRFTESGGRNIVGPRPSRRHERGDDHGGHHESRHDDSPRRGGRSRRGDVRLAILALLAERPMHGYEMMQELADRTKGIWRPSPGSLYPALQLLEDQGLVQSETEDGRRQFTLTEKGRIELTNQPKKSAPWDIMVRGANQDDFALRVALRQVSIAVSQVAEAGTQDQKVRAEQLILELRRQIYLLLAENVEPSKE